MINVNLYQKMSYNNESIYQQKYEVNNHSQLDKYS